MLYCIVGLETVVRCNLISVGYLFVLLVVKRKISTLTINAIVIYLHLKHYPGTLP